MCICEIIANKNQMQQQYFRVLKIELIFGVLGSDKLWNKKRLIKILQIKEKKILNNRSLEY